MSRKSAVAHYERNKHRYRTMFENLLAVLSDPKGYKESVSGYLRQEYERRSRAAVSASLLVVLSAVFMVIVVILFLDSAFLILESYIENQAMTAFILGWIVVLLFFVALWLALGRYRTAFTGRR